MKPEDYSSTIQKYIDDPDVSRDWIVNALLEEVKRLEIELQELKGKKMSDYRDLGNISAVDPPYQKGLSCDYCKVRWIGCWDQFCCPECGDAEDWEAQNNYLKRKMNKRDMVWNKSKGHCWYCGVKLPNKGWHVDHFKALHRGAYEGTGRESFDDIENLVPACAGCNLFKSASSIEGFRGHIEKQKESVRKHSSGFRIAERMGIIEVKPVPVIFWYEKAQC